MKLLAINGSPRKRWNTATLLEKALEGAASRGAETELVHLYDIDFKGCVSCFACKTLGGASYGRCVVKDGLKRVLDEVTRVDAVLVGSPVYLGSVTGETQSFLERLIFPYLAYTDPPTTLFPKKIRTGFIYTLGAGEERVREGAMEANSTSHKFLLEIVFGSARALWCCDTWQFEDYSKVYAPRFDVAKKARRREEVFPEDCRRAFDLGAELVS